MRMLYIVILLPFLLCACFKIEREYDLKEFSVDLSPIDDVYRSRFAAIEFASQHDATPNQCFKKIATAVFGNDFSKLPEKIPVEVKINGCPKQDTKAWLFDNALGKSKLIEGPKTINTYELDECQRKYLTDDKVSIKEMRIEIVSNTLNQESPLIEAYVVSSGNSETPSREQLQDAVFFNTQVAFGKLILAGTLPSITPNTTTSYVTLERQNATRLVTEILRESVTVVFTPKDIQLKRIEEGGQEFYLKPTGALTFKAKAVITIDINVLDDTSCLVRK